MTNLTSRVTCEDVDFDLDRKTVLYEIRDFRH